MTSEPQPEAPEQGAGDASAAPQAGPPARPSVAVVALLVLASLAVAAAILFAVGWITGDRFAGSGNAAAADRRPIEPQEEFVLPEGSEPLPARFTGGQVNPALGLATVPGRLEAVRGFFVRQGAEKGWTFMREGLGQKSVTLFFQKRGAVRMIVVREAPSGATCTVAVHAAADPWRDADRDRGPAKPNADAPQ